MRYLQTLIFAFLSLFGLSAFADPPSFAAITGGIDFSTVGPAILSVAALLGTVYVVSKGARIILSFIK